MFTRPVARGLAAVIVALEEEARIRGFPLMRLETGEASPAAIALYSRLGYRRRGPFWRLPWKRIERVHREAALTGYS